MSINAESAYSAPKAQHQPNQQQDQNHDDSIEINDSDLDMLLDELTIEEDIEDSDEGDQPTQYIKQWGNKYLQLNTLLTLITLLTIIYLQA